MNDYGVKVIRSRHMKSSQFESVEYQLESVELITINVKGVFLSLVSGINYLTLA